MILSSFSLTEASLAVVSILGACGAVISTLKFSSIKCCKVVECERIVEEPLNEEPSVITTQPDDV